MDVNHLAGLLHDDFHCTTYPLSLKHPDATKEQWIERTKFAIEVWTHLEVWSLFLFSFFPPLLI